MNTLDDTTVGAGATSVGLLARDLPKVELHCHLEGTVRRDTFVELATHHGIELPPGDPADMFHFDSLAAFLEVFALVCASVQTADDFRRITYESLEDAAAAGVRYREMFFSPGFALPYGVTPETAWEGIEAGLADAHADLDIRCRMILDVDKAAPPSSALELVQFAAAKDRDLLIGVGGDNTERGIDHRIFADAFAEAGRLGLRRCFHAGEDGPAENIRIAIEQLGCDRIDHGVHLLDDPELTQMVVDRGVPLTVCPLSNVILSATVPDVASHPLALQRAAGVIVTLNSDDPTYSDTTIADDYQAVADAFGYDMATMQELSLAGIDASWAPDDERAALHQRFAQEFTELAAGSI